MTARNSRVFCVVNPARKHHDRVWQLVQDHCAALGYPPPTLLATTIAEPGGAQAQAALEAGADLVIVAGGDGTIRNVSNVLAHTGVPIGIIPTGTANIFHLNAIGKMKRLDTSVRTALLGPDISLDTGMVRLEFASGEQLTDRFLVVIGVGRDALSLDGVSDRVKKITGPGAYFASGIPQLARKPLPMTVAIDNDPPETMASWSVLVGNCGVVPGRITIMPRANLADGKLNLLRVAPKSLVGWVPIAWRGLRGHHSPVRGLVDADVERVQIVPQQPAAVQVDGDVVHKVARVEISVDPASLVIRGRELRTDDATDPAGNGNNDTEEPVGLGEPPR